MAATLNELLIEIQELVEKLEVIGFGSAIQEVVHKNQTRPSLSKSLKEQMGVLQALVQGRKTFETKTALNGSGTPLPNVDGFYGLSEVWNDTTQNNGIYGWSGSAWVRSDYNSVTTLFEKTNAISPVTGAAVWQALEKLSISNNMFDMASTVSGYLPINAPSDGDVEPSGTAVTSDYIYVGDMLVGELLYIDGLSDVSYGRAYCYYDENKAVINDAVNLTGQDVDKATIVGRLTENTKYIRFTVVTTKSGTDPSLDAVTISRSAYLAPYESYMPAVSLFSGVPMTAQFAVNDGSKKNHALNRRFADDHLLFATDAELGLVNSPNNLIDINDVFDGGHLPVAGDRDGEIIVQSNYVTSGFFNITGLEVGVDSMYFSGFSGGYRRSIFFYDKNLNPVPNPSDPPQMIYVELTPGADKFDVVEIPNFRPVEAAVFARMTLITASGADLTALADIQVTKTKDAQYEAGIKIPSKLNAKPIIAQQSNQVPVNDSDLINLGDLKKRLNKVFIGQKLAVFGDSITAGSEEWHKYVASILGFSVYNYAESGGHWEDFTYNTSAAQWFSYQVDTFLAASIDPDVIVVAMGTNSMNEVWGDFDATLSLPLSSVDKQTIYGGMRHGIERLRVAHPGVPLFLCTPIQRASISPNDARFVAMVDGIKKIAAYYGCCVFECHSNVGILHQIEKDTVVYLPDGLHPNAAGSELQGRYIASRIRAEMGWLSK